MVLLDIAALALGLAVLSKASSLVVESSSRVSSALKISNLAVAFVIISVLTSLPELAISSIASLENVNAIAVGNIFGSVVANVLLVFGIGALFRDGINMSAARDDTALMSGYLEIAVVSIIAGAVLLSVEIGFAQSILLILAFVLYSMYMFKEHKNEAKTASAEDKSLNGAAVFFVSVIFVILSSELIVNSVVAIAHAVAIEEGIIGATIIAIGTSVPELSISIQALSKKDYGIALGTVVGSNIVDMTLVLGTAGLIRPLGITLAPLLASLGFAFLASIALLYMMLTKEKIRRTEGLVLLGIYAVYLIVTLYL